MVFPSPEYAYIASASQLPPAAIEQKSLRVVRCECASGAAGMTGTRAASNGRFFSAIPLNACTMVQIWLLLLTTPALQHRKNRRHCGQRGTGGRPTCAPHDVLPVRRHHLPGLIHQRAVRFGVK